MAWLHVVWTRERATRDAISVFVSKGPFSAVQLGAGGLGGDRERESEGGGGVEERASERRESAERTSAVSTISRVDRRERSVTESMLQWRARAAAGAQLERAGVCMDALDCTLCPSRQTTPTLSFCVLPSLAASCGARGSLDSMYKPAP